MTAMKQLLLFSKLISLYPINYIRMLHYTMRKNHEEVPSRRNNIASGPRQTMEGVTKKVKNYIFNMRDVIGKGSFSTVYLGKHQTTSDVVAIKVIELKKVQSEALSDLLNSEISTLQSLHHPNILHCLDVCFSASNCYIVTEYCNGGDFKDILKKQGSFDEKSASKIISEVYQGLKYLGERNIVHRDFKTSNVFINNDQIKIADFGFAKKIKQNFRDITIGSPLCMSPEGLIDNIYGPKTDVWAFGIFIYELLHEKNPFYFCQTKQQLRRAILEPVTIDSLKPGLSLDLKKLIVDCLQINHEKRISMEDIQYSTYFSKLRQSENTPITRNSDDYHMEKQSSLASTEVAFKTNLNQISKPTTRHESSVDEKMRFGDSRDSKNSNFLSKQQLSYKTISPKRKNLQQLLTNKLSSKNYQNKKERSLEQCYDLKNRSANLKDDQFFNKTVAISPCYKLRQRNKIFEPKQLIHNVTQFQDLLALLHYSRVLFKTIKISENYTSTNLSFLSTWLIQILGSINENIRKIQNPSLNILELKRIALEYQIRYSNELRVSKQETDPKRVKDKIVECLRILKTEQSYQSERQGNELIKYFLFIYELTDKLQESILSGDYQQFAENNNIEDFLLAKTSKLKSMRNLVK